MSARKKPSQRRSPGFQKLAAAGISPKLAGLVTRFVMAEAEWEKLNRKPDRLWLKAKDPKQKTALYHGGSHPLRRPANAAWAKMDQYEKEIRQHRPQSWAELVVKMRLDTYLGNFEQLRANDLLALTVADSKRLLRSA